MIGNDFAASPCPGGASAVDGCSWMPASGAPWADGPDGAGVEGADSGAGRVATANCAGGVVGADVVCASVAVLASAATRAVNDTTEPRARLRRNAAVVRE